MQPSRISPSSNRQMRRYPKGGTHSRSRHQDVAVAAGPRNRHALIAHATIEVTPKSAERLETFRGLLPPRRRVYIAHLEGVLAADMIEAARRITEADLVAMPHITARAIADEAALTTLLRGYATDAGVNEALVLAGGSSRCAGPYRESMDLIRTGLFEKFGFRRLHFAAHPEGHPIISEQRLREAMLVKQTFSAGTSIDVAFVTQFMFDPLKLVDWLKLLESNGINLPVHVGIPGPTNPAALLKYAMTCGVGSSLRMLQRQSGKALGLMKPFSIDDFVGRLAGASTSSANFAGCHIYPFGGITKTITWMRSHEALVDNHT